LSYSKEYYDEYYKKHRKRISEHRKKKYRTDKAFRERQLVRAKFNRKKKKSKVPRRSGQYRILINNDIYFTVRGLAKVLNRSRDSVYYYIKSGLVPSPSNIEGYHARYYTKAQVSIIRRAFLKYNCRRLSQTQMKDMKDFIMKGWTDGPGNNKKVSSKT